LILWAKFDGFTLVRGHRKKGTWKVNTVVSGLVVVVFFFFLYVYFCTIFFGQRTTFSHVKPRAASFCDVDSIVIFWCTLNKTLPLSSVLLVKFHRDDHSGTSNVCHLYRLQFVHIYAVQTNSRREAHGASLLFRRFSAHERPQFLGRASSALRSECIPFQFIRKGKRQRRSVWNFGLQLRFLRVFQAPFVSVRQTRRKWSWSPKLRTGEPSNFTISHFPASFLRVWQTRRNEARWTRRNKAGKFETEQASRSTIVSSCISTFTLQSNSIFWLNDGLNSEGANDV
jgi:hypothetical protein